MSRRTANMLLLLAGVVWGMGFVAQQTAMQDIGPMLFMTLRFLLATLVVLPFAVWERKKLTGSVESTVPFARLVWPAGLVGLFFFGTMSFQQVGLLATTVTSAGFLTGLYVVIVPLIVLLVLRRNQHWIIWPCAITALIGIYLLGDGGFSGLTWGDHLVIVGAVIGAGHIVIVGYTVQRYGHPIQVACIQFAVAAVISLIGHAVFILTPFTRAIEPEFALQPILNAAPEILYAGIFAGGLAFTLMAVAQRHTREADAAIFLSSEALFAALFGAILLGERLNTIGYIGCGLIFVAIIAVQIIPARRAITKAATAD